MLRGHQRECLILYTVENAHLKLSKLLCTLFQCSIHNYNIAYKWFVPIYLKDERKGYSSRTVVSISTSHAKKKRGFKSRLKERDNCLLR